MNGLKADQELQDWCGVVDRIAAGADGDDRESAVALGQSAVDEVNARRGCK